jgi:ribosomal protein L7/L12
MTANTEFEQDVVDALGKGRKIDAIKLLREHRSIGLKHAKELVDRHIRENPNSVPAIQKNKSGNGLIFVVCLAVAAYFLYKYAT